MHTDPFRTGRDPHPEREHHTQPGAFGDITKPDADYDAVTAAIARAVNRPEPGTPPYIVRTPDEPYTYADGGAECDTDTLAAADLSPHLANLAHAVRESIDRAHHHTSPVPGCYRCDLSSDEPHDPDDAA